ncbi:MAG: MCE family protein [Micromonosporaceae bacterium]|nr:MCE family protein [Micromonosporaceae bacterium]
MISRLRGLHRLRKTCVAFLAAVMALTFGLAGCSKDGGSAIPLPGGAPRGDYFTITAEFDDVLDLVPEASVKVNDVSVGSVERIWLRGWKARVALRIDKSVTLPDNAIAALRQTSLLGEKFVALDPPERGKSYGRLSDGDLIPLARTRRSTDIEEVFSAMAMLLNGGGLAELRTINREIGKALHGREADVKKTLKELNRFVGGLDDQKKDIVRAIDAMDKLSARLAKDRGKVAKALDSLGPGLKTLAQQRKDLVAMLTSLKKLGKVGTKVIRASRDDTVSVLRDLQPVLTELVKAGDEVPKRLYYLLTFPVPPEALKAIHPDKTDPRQQFVNLSITLDLDAKVILHNLTCNPEPAPDEPGSPPPSDPDDRSSDQPCIGGHEPESPVKPGAPVAPRVPGLPGEADGQRGGLADLLIGGLTR